MRRLFLIFMALTCLGFSPSRAWAQASVNVDSFDPVYRDVNKLVAHGLVDKIIMGQRPWSRREFARITGEAMRHRSRLQDRLEDPNLSQEEKEKIRRRLEYVDAILSRLQGRFQEELVQLGFVEGESKWYSVHPLELVDFDVTVTDSPPQTLPPQNGVGAIDAVINPLVNYRQGRHLVDGSNISLETTHWFRFTNHLAIYAQPRFQLAFGRDGQPNDNNVYVQNLYGKIYVKNFEIQVGRGNLFYGQGEDAGLLLSNNPRGLDMVKISNDDPFFFPRPFRFLGAHKISFFYADLGPEQNFPNAYLSGWKWSLQPLSFLELGAGFATQSGGEGSPPASFGQRVGDIFPIAHLFVNAQDQIGNKIGSFDFRLRIPVARGLELYGEAAFDDIHRTTAQVMFVDDAAYIGGFYLPRLTNSGSVDLRGEYHRTGLRFYEHGQFTSGWTLNQFLIGDNLGPNAQGVYGKVNFDVNPEHLLVFSGAWESRSGDVYVMVTPEDSPEFFQKVEDKPEEIRLRGMVDWIFRMNDFPLKVLVQMGFERVQNFNYVAGNDRNNYLGRINLQFDVDRWTKFPRQ
jgi:hypothetical protein